MSLEDFPGEHPNVFRSMGETYENKKEKSTLLKDLNELCEADEDLKYLFEELKDTSQRYVEDVCKLLEMKEEEAKPDRDAATAISDQDDKRTRLHNSVISSINPLYRAIINKGKDAKPLKKFVGSNRNAYFSAALELTYNLIIEALNKKKNESGKESALKESVVG